MTSYLQWPSIFPLDAIMTGNSVPRWISEFYVHITMKISLNMTHNMFKYVEIQVSNQRSKVRSKEPGSHTSQLECTPGIMAA